MAETSVAEPFRVVFTDKKNRQFKREYLTHIFNDAKKSNASNDAVARQWAEKQRDVWNHHYDYGGKGSEFLTDPRTWILKVTSEVPSALPEKSESAKGGKKEKKNATK